MEAEIGRARGLVVLGETVPGFAAGAVEYGVWQVVCTHQLGLVVGHQLQIFLHSSDFIDADVAAGGATDGEDGREHDEEEGEEQRKRRGKRRRTEVGHQARPLPGLLRFAVQPQAKIVQVAATWAHALLLDEAGELYSVGWNAYGQCGTGDRHQLKIMLTSPRYVRRGPGTGEVWAWGSNRYGQLGLEEDAVRLRAWESSELSKEGDARFTEDDFVHTAPQRLLSLARDGVRAERVFSGWNFSIVLSELGQLFSFGWGMYAQLGHGDLNNEFLPRPIDFDQGQEDDGADAVDENEDVIDCACGLWHAAAITESGRVYTWGYGKDGQMGNGTTKGNSSPQLVVALKGERATQVCCGTRHTAVLTDKGEVFAWGFNAFGQVAPLDDGVISGEGSNVLTPTKAVSPPPGQARGVWAGPWSTFISTCKL